MAKKCELEDSMSDQLDDKIKDSVKSPKKAKGDSVEVEQHGLQDQIAADKYLEWTNRELPPAAQSRELRESIGSEHVFFKYFDGTPFRSYESLPEIAAFGRKCGVRELCVWDRESMGTYGVLNSGKNVIDASRNFTRAERSHIRAIVNNLGYRTFVIYVTTSEAIARQRWRENRKNPARCDVTDDDFEAIVRAMEPPATDEHPLLFHSSDDIDDWITNNLQDLM